MSFWKWSLTISEIKRCTKCAVSKSLEEFSKLKAGKFGKSPWCKECARDYKQLRYSDPVIREADKAKARNRYAEMTQEEKESRSVQQRKYNLGRKYGLTHNDLEHMYSHQGKSCGICGEAYELGELVVDHDHSCCPTEITCHLCVRGLLCTVCNVRLGIIENVDWVEKAKEYINN